MWQLVAFLAYSEALTCPAYSCGSTTITTGQCQVYSSSTGVNSYKVTPCEIGLICPETTSVSTACQNYPVYTRYPGEYCDTNIDCMSGICDYEVCLGLNSSNSTNCTTTADCDPGLYCGDFKCVSQLIIDSACTTNDQCTNDAYCDNKKCVQMFSLATGIQTYTMINSFAPLCMTGYATNVSNILTCAVAPQSVSLNGAKACPVVGHCVANDGKTTKSCECSYSGEAYCPLFEGDSYVQSMISSWKLLFSYSVEKCNGLSRYSYACFIKNETVVTNYLNWAVNASLYFDGSWYKKVNAPNCIQKTFLLDYYNLVNEYQLSLNRYYTCAFYEKAYNSHIWPITQCIYYTYNIYSNEDLEIYQVGSCATGKCNAENDYNSTCVNNTSKRYPGEYCTYNNECIGNYCFKNRCVGQKLGQSCFPNYSYCDPGLYCGGGDNRVCVSVNDNMECGDYTDCTTSHSCLFGKCVERYSLNDGALTEISYANGYSIYCKSGFSYINNTNSLSYCGPAPRSPEVSLPIKCLGGSKCKDSTGNNIQYCECGYSGSGYCPLYVGDLNYLKNTITYFKKISSKVSCYNNLLTALCVMYDSDLLYDYYQYFVNEQNMVFTPLYYNADPSIIEVFQNDYYTAVKYINDSSSSSSSSDGSSSSFAKNLVAGTLTLLFLG